MAITQAWGRGKNKFGRTLCSHPPLPPRLRLWPCEGGCPCGPSRGQEAPWSTGKGEAPPPRALENRGAFPGGAGRLTRGPPAGVPRNPLGILLGRQQNLPGSFLQECCWIIWGASQETHGTGSCCCWNLGPLGFPHPNRALVAGARTQGHSRNQEKAPSCCSVPPVTKPAG